MTIKFHEPQTYLSSATTHGGIVYVSGLAADDISQGIEGQTSQTLASIDRVLAQAGSDKSNLMRVEIWLADMDDFDAMNRIYVDWLDPEHIPARVCVEARLWDRAAKIEIMVTAAGPVKT